VPADETALTAPQEKAIRLLVEGWKLVDIARELDISRRTLWQWRRAPAFREELDRYQAEALRDVRLHLTRLGTSACEALETALRGDGSQNSVTAAREVLDRIGASFAPPTHMTLELRELPTTGNPWLPGETAEPTEP
jgi:hypothetical protein